VCVCIEKHEDRIITLLAHDPAGVLYHLFLPPKPLTMDANQPTNPLSSIHPPFLPDIL
jgi:hypothetical protein